MKKIKLYLSAVITAGLMLFTACEKDAVDPLSGKYPAPENYALATLLSQDAEKGATIRIFTLELGSSSQYLSVEFAGNRLNHLLPAGNYTIADQSFALSNKSAGDNEAGVRFWRGANELPAESQKLVRGIPRTVLCGIIYPVYRI